MASGRPRREGSCCCSMEAKAQLRSTTSVVGSARLSPKSTIEQMFAALAAVVQSRLPGVFVRADRLWQLEPRRLRLEPSAGVEDDYALAGRDQARFARAGGAQGRSGGLQAEVAGAGGRQLCLH